jgi:hypothetical protein
MPPGTANITVGTAAQQQQPSPVTKQADGWTQLKRLEA